MPRPRRGAGGRLGRLAIGFDQKTLAEPDQLEDGNKWRT